MDRVDMVMEVVAAARAVKDDWAERSFTKGANVRHSPPLMNKLANALYWLDQHVPETPPSTTKRARVRVENIPGGDPRGKGAEEVLVENLFSSGPDPAIDGPQEDHHEAAGPPSEVNSGTGRSIAMSKAWRYKIDKKEVLHIFCKKCGEEVTGIQQWLVHSC